MNREKCIYRNFLHFVWFYENSSKAANKYVCCRPLKFWTWFNGWQPAYSLCNLHAYWLSRLYFIRSTVAECVACRHFQLVYNVIRLALFSTFWRKVWRVNVDAKQFDEMEDVKCKLKAAHSSNAINYSVAVDFTSGNGFIPYAHELDNELLTLCRPSGWQQRTNCTDWIVLGNFNLRSLRKNHQFFFFALLKRKHHKLIHIFGRAQFALPTAPTKN